MDESRNQVVKLNTSPGAAAMNPVGLGIMVRSAGRVMVPADPELRICPGPT
jgi:hypothetical protein